VVGASGHSYSTLEKTVPVKQKLMILPTLPRVARPGDAFSLPVSVFATDSTIRKVDLSLALSATLRAEGPATASLPFDKPGEKDTAFWVSVGDAIGADTATVMATSGPFSADYTVHMPITSANPFYTEVTDTTVLKDYPVTLTPEKFGLEGTNEARVAFSRMPDIQLDKRYAYLIRYPYGCIEQTVSAAFPQIYLPYLVDLKPHQKQAVTDHVNATIKKLGRFRADKGFSFWPFSNRRQNRYTDWGTSYAGHFLVEARELGYHVPGDLYDHWLKDARRNAKKVNTKNHRYQTYRLFVLALGGKPHLGAMNLVRENYLRSLDPLSRKLLAAAYYVSGSHDIAREINETASTEIIDYREMSGTYGSALRDRALVTYLCVKMNDMQTASYLLREVAKAFRPFGWYSTQETAMAILGIGAYSKGSPFPGGAVKFRVKMGDGKRETMTLTGYQTVLDLPDMWGKPVTIENESDNPLFVSLFEEGIPVDSRIKTERHGIELTRGFYGEDGTVIDVGARPQGEPFWVIYKVQSTFDTPLKELALTSVLPSGWEILNPRVTMESPPTWVKRLQISSGEYMDIRDDRVNWFFDLSPRQRTVFGIKINPTFKGSYALPPVVVEAMYSPEFYARIAGWRASVK
ncbi:MAG: hypothetical protein JSW58_16200, partial [Candidatus Latescibacterota bacterium]